MALGNKCPNRLADNHNPKNQQKNNMKNPTYVGEVIHKHNNNPMEGYYLHHAFHLNIIYNYEEAYY
jgi:hypothetical protein